MTRLSLFRDKKKHFSREGKTFRDKAKTFREKAKPFVRRQNLFRDKEKITPFPLVKGMRQSKGKNLKTIIIKVNYRL